MDGDGLVATISFKKCSEYFRKLQELGEAADKGKVIEDAVRAGAKPVADAIRKNLETLPEQDFQRLQEGQLFEGVSESQKEDLLNGFGLAPIKRDKRGFVHTKAGFEGYGSFPTPTYPRGVPNQLLAGAVESGSSVRQKTPFVAPAVKESRTEAITAMEDVIDQQMKEIFEGG